MKEAVINLIVAEYVIGGMLILLVGLPLVVFAIFHGITERRKTNQAIKAVLEEDE